MTVLENIWTFVGSRIQQDSHLFQQKGALSHCTNRALTFFRGKIENRVINRGSECQWSARSPGLNQIVSWFWGQVDSTVSMKQPKTLVEVKIIVEDRAAIFKRMIIHLRRMELREERRLPYRV